MSELYKHLNILAKMHEHICVKLDGILEITELLRDKHDAPRRNFPPCRIRQKQVWHLCRWCSRIESSYHGNASRTLKAVLNVKSRPLYL